MAANNSSTNRPLQTFQHDGVLALPQVIDVHEIVRLRGHLWDEIEQKFAIREHNTDSWFANPHNPAGGSRGRRLSGMNSIMENLRTTGALRTAEVAIQRELDVLFGGQRWEPLPKWYSLLSFPGTEATWSVPRTSWHNDEPIVVGDHEPWSIFVFVFLDRVEQETGPTVAVTGSHRRGEVIALDKGVYSEREVRAFANVNGDIVSDPAELRVLPVGTLLQELTATNEWFSDLVANPESEAPNDQREPRLTQQGTSQQGITSRVVDLSADAGDIILLDPRCLHTVSANVSNRPRQVLRLDFRRTAPGKTYVNS